MVTTTRDLLALAHEVELLIDRIDLAAPAERVEIEGILDGLLESAAQEVPDKLDALRHVALRLGALEELHRAEAHRQELRARSLARGAERCKRSAEALVRAYGDVQTTTTKYRLQQGPPSVQGPEDVDAWADEGWVRVSESKDRRAAVASLKALPGDEWPEGFRLVRKESIRW